MCEGEVYHDALSDQDTHTSADTREPQVYEGAYPLHRAAFHDDVPRLTTLLKKLPASDICELDCHGNNALHVAALKGCPAAVQVLLDAGVPAASRSSRGWTALDEALAAKALPTARLLQQKLLADAKTELKQKRAQLLESMKAMPDYSLQLQWQLGSSVPGLGLLLRRYAPHDTYTIWKVGERLRVDGTLMGLDTKNIMPQWKRGHFSLIVDGSPAGMAAAATAAAAAVTAASAEAEARVKKEDGIRCRASSATKQQQKQKAAAPASATASSSCSSIDRQANGTDLPLPLAASSNGSSTTTQQQQQQPEHDDEPCDEEFFDVADPDPQTVQSDAAADAGSTAGTFVAGSSAAGSHSTAGGSVARDSPHLLFLNHVKKWWIDLSADKKTLKLEGKGEEDELEEELALAMERDVDKVRLKPRNFTFAPVRGWLGGPYTEKVEGWKCQVYEATGKLLAVNTSKAKLHLPADAVFEDYLAAEYEADAVRETFLDPMAPPGVGSSRSDTHQGQASTSAEAAGDSEDELSGVEDPTEGSTRHSSSSTTTTTRRAVSAADREGAAANEGGRLLKARCWMAEDFPMHLNQLLPLLDVIGTTNKHMAKVGKFLSTYSQMDMFPVKLQVPLLLTVHVLVGFKAFQPLVPKTSHPPPPADFFEVPPHFNRRLLQDAMDKAAAGMLGVRGRRQQRHTVSRDLDEYDLDTGAAADDLDVVADDDEDYDGSDTADDPAGNKRRHSHALLLGGEDGGCGDDELLLWAASSSASSEETPAKPLDTTRSSIDASTKVVERAAADVERQMLAEVADDTASSVSGSVSGHSKAGGKAMEAAAKKQKQRGALHRLRRAFRWNKKQ